MKDFRSIDDSFDLLIYPHFIHRHACSLSFCAGVVLVYLINRYQYHRLQNLYRLKVFLNILLLEKDLSTIYQDPSSGYITMECFL